MQDPDLTSVQIKAARAVLGWSVAELAEVTGIGTATINRYEAAEGVPRSRKGHLATLRHIFESKGVRFVGTPEDGPGIRVYAASPAPRDSGLGVTGKDPDHTT